MAAVTTRRNNLDAYDDILLQKGGDAPPLIITAFMFFVRIKVCFQQRVQSYKVLVGHL